uniref:RNA-directed RNA polymerase L n=1 Tax=Lygus hesperus TaxID=30085 RepID=A0A0A9WZU9_LYGHE
MSPNSDWFFIHFLILCCFLMLHVYVSPGFCEMNRKRRRGDCVVTNHFPRQHGSDVPGRKSKQIRCRQCQRVSHTVKKTVWHCPACPEQPGLCHEPCFENWHREMYVDNTE